MAAMKGLKKKKKRLELGLTGSCKICTHIIKKYIRKSPNLPAIIRIIFFFNFFYIEIYMSFFMFKSMDDSRIKIY